MGYQVPPNSGLQNFATASRWCFQQNSSTVELVDRIYEWRSKHRTWKNAHIVYEAYTSVLSLLSNILCVPYIYFLKNFPTQVLMFCACVYFMTMQKWLNQLRCRLAPSSIYDWCVWLCGACICIHVFLVSKEFCEYCAITARSIGLLLIAWQPTNGPVGQLGAQKGPPQSLSVAGCTFLFRATGSSGPRVADILVL